MFFERGTQSSTRHRKLRYLLLFSLRALLVLLLALVFANPFLRRSSAAASDRLLVVVVDNSFSMRAGTRLEDAKRGALEVLATRKPSQRAQVMVLSGELQVLTQPIKDAGALKAAVESIQPGDSHEQLRRAGAWDAGAGGDGAYAGGSASVQRYAGFEYAGELCRYGDAGECFAGAASGGEGGGAELDCGECGGSGAVGGSEERRECWR